MQVKHLLFSLLFLFSSFSLFSQTLQFSPEEGIRLIQEAYPTKSIVGHYSKEKKDWFMAILNQEEKEVFIYWAGGKLLTEEELKESKNYQRQFYYYPEQTFDPNSFSVMEVSQIQQRTSIAKRKKAPIQSPTFLNTLYNTHTKESTLESLEKMNFLKKEIQIHKELVLPLNRIQKKLFSMKLTDPEIKKFLKNIDAVYGFSWREVRDTSSRSYHSYGLAVDILPIDWKNKIVYWMWERDGGNQEWMKVPLSNRWAPPAKVIEVFEAEGFIWGGRWLIFDNMHFEYRPELLKMRSFSNNKAEK